VKPGARIAAFSTGPIKRGSGARILMIGVIAREGKVEGILSGKIRTEGSDATATMARLIAGSRFKEQVKAIALNGVALAGLNVVDLEALESKGYEYIVLTRYRQRPSLLIKAIRLREGKNPEKETLVAAHAAVKQCKTGGFYYRSSVPLSPNLVAAAYEALRLSHLISNGISTGESKGRI
jgi:endonuclease V-like protein UPF0215 family